jgi:hypothetical protein
VTTLPLVIDVPGFGLT